MLGSGRAFTTAIRRGSAPRWDVRSRSTSSRTPCSRSAVRPHTESNEEGREGVIEPWRGPARCGSQDRRPDQRSWGAVRAAFSIQLVVCIDISLGMLIALSCRLDRKEHTSELQSLAYLVCRLLLEKK